MRKTVSHEKPKKRAFAFHDIVKGYVMNDNLANIWKNPDSFEIIRNIASHLGNPDSFETIQKIVNHLEKIGEF